MIPVNLAKIVIRSPEGKYLILRSSEWPENPRRSLQPDLPGGMIEEGETPEIGVLRELHEETGLKLAENDLNLAYVGLETRHGDVFQRHVYFANTTDTEIKLSWEHDAYWWMSAAEVLKLHMRDPYPEVFQKLHSAKLLI